MCIKWANRRQKCRKDQKEACPEYKWEKRALSELVYFGHVLEAGVGEGAEKLGFVEAFGGAELVEVRVSVAQHGVDAAEKNEWIHGDWGLN